MYAPILRPPQEGARVALGPPADRRRFGAANVLGGKAPAALEQTPAGVAVRVRADTTSVRNNTRGTRNENCHHGNGPEVTECAEVA